jgi:hypothetical protein
MMDKVALGKVFSEYFGFPCQFSFHRLLHIYHHRHHHHLSFGAGTIGQIVTNVLSGLSLTPPQETKLITRTNYVICNQPSLESQMKPQAQGPKVWWRATWSGYRTSQRAVLVKYGTLIGWWSTRGSGTELGEKSAPGLLRPPRTSRRIKWDWTRIHGVRSWSLTFWTVAWPRDHVFWGEKGCFTKRSASRLGGVEWYEWFFVLFYFLQIYSRLYKWSNK